MGRAMQFQDRKLAGDPVSSGSLESGLTIYAVPKPRFQQKYAVFAVHYGSIDSRFVPPGEGAPVEVPEGIAHFLEHKMFEKERGDVFADFAKIGASANAYTSYTMTAYLFSTVEHFQDALELLLRFVQEPYFTEASVRKEQGIIEQELRMYEDDPARALIIRLMGAMYRVHPVRHEIGGTVESIRRIAVPMLYQCHQTFYRPANAALAVAGDVDVQAVWETARALFARPQAGEGSIERIDPEEPQDVLHARVETRLAVSRPRLALGIKDHVRGLSGRALVRRDLAISLALDAALGRSSDGFTELYEKGLIDDAFGARYVNDTRFAHTVMGGETPDPDRLEQALREILQRSADRGVDAETFERLRRREVGDFVAALDNPESVANVLVSLHFRGATPFDYLDGLQELTPGEVSELFREHVDPARMAVSVVLPHDGARTSSDGAAAR